MQEIITTNAIFSTLKFLTFLLMIYFIYRAVRSGTEWMEEYADSSGELGSPPKYPWATAAIAVFGAIAWANFAYYDPLIRPTNTMIEVNRADIAVTQALEERADLPVPPARNGNNLEDMGDRLNVRENFEDVEPLSERNTEEAPPQ